MAVRRQVARGRRDVRRAARAVREQAVRAGGQASKATAKATARAKDFARRARDGSVARVLDLRDQARDEFVGVDPPHLCFVMSPRRPIRRVVMRDTLRIATYNVHRWQGGNGRSEPDVARAGYVISELDADVIALQEVLRPFRGLEPRRRLCGARRRGSARAPVRRARAASRLRRDPPASPRPARQRDPLPLPDHRDLRPRHLLLPHRAPRRARRPPRRRACGARRHRDPSLPRRPHAQPPGPVAARAPGAQQRPRRPARRHERLAQMQGLPGPRSLARSPPQPRLAGDLPRRPADARPRPDLHAPGRGRRGPPPRLAGRAARVGSSARRGGGADREEEKRKPEP